MHATRFAIVLAAALVATPGWAQHAGHGAHGNAGAPAADAMASGEIRRVDVAGSRLTIRHGNIPSLDMPPMTMVFRVRDAALLEGLKAGDRIRFLAEKDGSQYVVTALAHE